VHARWLGWRIHVAFGRLHLSRREPSAAEQSFASARALVDELAAAIPDRTLRENFVMAALGSMPARRPHSARRQAKEQFGGLTTREREVAALVAGGLSNRAVAERLIVGERTVETYVSSILNKLGYASRAQIAAWAVDKGLAKPT
jgi:DNA-binding NarL/FixJ family response regulator